MNTNSKSRDNLILLLNFFLRLLPDRHFLTVALEVYRVRPSDLDVAPVNQDEAARVTVAIPGVIQNDFREIGQDHLNQPLGRGCALVHAGRGIDFDEPDAQVFVNHKIIPEEFEAVLPIVNDVLHALQRGLHVLLDLRPDLGVPGVVAMVSVDVVGELLRRPHVAVDFVVFELGVLFLHRVVGQVVFTLVASGIVVGYAKANVRLLVAPNGQGVPVGDQHPLPDVELPVLHHERVLDAFLDDPQSRVPLQKIDPVHDPLEGFVNLDAAASGARTRLQKPQVLSAVHVELRELFPEREAQVLDVLK